MITMRLKDKKNGCLSKDVPIEEIILDQYEIEFEFPNYIDEYGDVMDIATLPYKDFLFFKNDYEVIIDEHTPIVMEVDEEHVKQQLDYFKNRDLVYVSGGRGYGKTQYEKLQHNWNELKTWIEEQRDFIENVPTFSRDIKNNHMGMIGSYNNCLEKMEEIEKKNNE